MKISYKIVYAIIGAGLIPLLMRINIHGTGLENNIDKYVIPFLVGSSGGLLIGHMKDKWRSLVDNQQQMIIERTADLQKAVNEIKTLKGLLPLCSFCKKIRDEDGCWQEVDVYIDHHSEADVTHSICPNCLKIHYPATMDN